MNILEDCDINTIEKITQLKNLSVYSKLVSVDYYNNLYKKYKKRYNNRNK